MEKLLLQDEHASRVYIEPFSVLNLMGPNPKEFENHDHVGTTYPAQRSHDPLQEIDDCSP